MRWEFAAGLALAAVVFFGVVKEESILSLPVLTASVATSPGKEPSTPAAEVPYVEVLESCNWDYSGACVNVRSGPGKSYPVVLKLREGMVLKVADLAEGDDGTDWYKIAPDGNILYPERITSDWYVAADLVHLVYTDGDHELSPGQVASTSKRIVVSLSKEMLWAYDGDTLFMQAPISTGLELTPTPLGTFTVFKKTPSRYMQGPIPEVSDQYYDLPGVPWNLYFTQQGAVIHGAYWHNHFGQPWSHGCINLPVDQAKALYQWAQVGMAVTVEP